MIFFSFLGLIALSCIAAIFRWRWGLFLVILIGVLQDPVRKLTPGVPGYLTLSTVPVWTACLIGAFHQKELRWKEFGLDCPALRKSLNLFFVALIPSAVMSATYSTGSWQITILGVFSVVYAIGAMLMGYRYPRREGDMELWIMVYCVLTGVAMIGGVFDRFHYHPIPGLVGTERMGMFWATWRTGGLVRMLAGFYRSPDVMGWHAALLVMLSLLLALQRRGAQFVLFVLLSGWGGVGVMLCARRKMLGLLMVFIAAFIGFLILHRQVKRGVGVIAVGLIVLLAGFYFSGSSRDTEVDEFYSSTVGEAFGRLYNHSVGVVEETVKKAGLFGFGLGMTATGAHHLNVKRPRVWQEGGLGKILADIGVVGALSLLGVIYVFVRESHRILVRVANFPHASLYFGFAAILSANAVMGVVSAQIYGDPFVGTLLPFVSGLFLSALRLRVKNEEGP